MEEKKAQKIENAQANVHRWEVEIRKYLERGDGWENELNNAREYYAVWKEILEDLTQ